MMTRSDAGLGILGYGIGMDIGFGFGFGFGYWIHTGISYVA
jgi:hypothetical protein